MTPSYDVLAIGNAIVDVLVQSEEPLLQAENLVKGAMTLIDEPRAEHLSGVVTGIREPMAPRVISGGSAANTAVGVAALGARAAYIGKVRQDPLGAAFTSDMQAQGVAFATAPATSGPATARCFVFVTPDGERTMNTYLGACQNLTVDDIDPAVVQAARITYLEGYLWDPPAAKEAFRRAATIAHAAGQRVALSLSDSFCVDRYRDEFLELIRTGAVDIVFANTHEVRALYQTADFDTAVAAFRAEVGLGVVTRSAEGSVVVTKDRVVAVPAEPIGRLVDTTGAGDLFAAGFLAGLAAEASHETCARLGALAAAEIIQHIGARPEVDIGQAARTAGLLPPR